MRAPFVPLIACTVLLVFGMPAAAQEGHPLKGSWIGQWESNETHGEFIVVVLDWDGERITGVVNPGTDNMPIDNATLDPEAWVFRFEADAEDASGTTWHYVVEGRIEDLELPNRGITGTWRHQNDGGAFEIRRQ